MNVEIGAEAALFPEKEYISGIFVAVRKTRKLESFHEKHFVERKNEGRKPDKNLCLRRLEFMLRNFD